MAIHARATYGDNRSPVITVSKLLLDNARLRTYSRCFEQKTEKPDHKRVFVSIPKKYYFKAYPALFLSTSPGATARTYVQVHMNSRITSSNDWKLKSADYIRVSWGF